MKKILLLLLLCFTLFSCEEREEKIAENIEVIQIKDKLIQEIDDHYILYVKYKNQIIEIDHWKGDFSFIIDNKKEKPTITCYCDDFSPISVIDCLENSNFKINKFVLYWNEKNIKNFLK